MADPAEQDNPVEEEVRPTWLPEKFETPEAMAKSYAEAERQLTELATQNKAMEDNFQTLAQQLEELEARPAQNQTDVQQQWQEMYETDPVGTMALLAQQAARQEAQTLQQQRQPRDQSQAALVAAYATREVEGRYADFNDQREAIQKEVGSNPRFRDENIWSNPQTAVDALDEAYTLVKGRAMIANPEKYQEDMRAAKLAAQSATGGSPRPAAPDTDKDDWERIKNAGGGSYSDLMRPRS